jgi:predicted house-cleaning NTP pyrophosphatase (Maf/HAM1 superfamily)
MGKPPIVLASTSRYRRDLLTRLGVSFKVAAPNVDELALPRELPVATASRLAMAKARDVAPRREEARVVLEAEALLDSVSRKRNLEAPQPAAAGADEEAESEGMAADLIRALASGNLRK